MYKLFFNKENDQRKWLVLFGLFTPLIISIWGLMLTIQANNLARATADNREQIDTLTNMVKELRRQNDLLHESVVIQKDQLIAYQSAIQYTKRPVLRFTEEQNDILSDGINMGISIYNSGGDVFNLTATSIKGANADITSFPANRQIPSLREIHIYIKHVQKTGSGISLRFTDNMMNQYSQDIIWINKNGTYEMQIGSLNHIKN